MQNFEGFLARHSEHSVQALVEKWERYEGVAVTAGASLEERWARFIGHMPDGKLCTASA